MFSAADLQAPDDGEDDASTGFDSDEAASVDLEGGLEDEDDEVEELADLENDDEDQDKFDVEDAEAMAGVEGVERLDDLEDAEDSGENVFDEEEKAALLAAVANGEAPSGDEDDEEEDEDDDVGGGEDDDDLMDGDTTNRQGAVDLRRISARMQESVRILADWATLGKKVPGKSRSELVQQTLGDICEYFGYNSFLAEKLWELFSPEEVRFGSTPVGC